MVDFDWSIYCFTDLEGIVECFSLNVDMFVCAAAVANVVCCQIIVNVKTYMNCSASHKQQHKFIARKRIAVKNDS